MKTRAVLNALAIALGGALALIGLLAIALLLLMADLVYGQDGGEIANGTPRSSVGRIVPVPVGTAGAPLVSFIQPKRFYVLAPPTGTDIPLQIRIEPHPDNRYYIVRWSGEGCGGTHAKTLNGDDEPMTQPQWQVRVGAGTCVFVATVVGSGDRLRARAEIVVHVNDMGEQK